jgi:alpha-L-rhamnosidase
MTLPMTMPRILLTALLLLSFAPRLPALEGQAALPVHLQSGDVTAPQLRLAWSLDSAQAKRGLHETAFKVRVATTTALLATDKPDLWTSGKVASSSMNAIYAGKTLPAGITVVWQVRSWQSWIGHPRSQTSAWSAPATFVTGLAHWSASWIAATPDAKPGTPLGVANDLTLPIFRRSVTLRDKPLSAMLFVSGLGQYEFRINGSNITPDVLTPGWTDYGKHILYDTYDVTSMLNSGKNALAVLLGNGMYNALEVKGRYSKFSSSYGQPQLIAELHLTFADGATQTIVTDNHWRTAAGPITFSNTYGGEDFNASLERTGWDSASFDDAAWAQALVVASPGGAPVPRLVLDQMPPIRIIAHYKTVAITHPRAGVTVYDLDQNFAGWPAVTVTGPAGASVRMLCGELLDKDGFVTQRSANAFPDDPALFDYTLRGTGEPENWHPRFSYYGFRYVQVETTSPKVAVINLTGEAIRQDDAQTGTFSSSDQLLDRIHQLILNALDSNLVSILTDCPHREKLGWLEQTHLFAASLMSNYDVEALYRKMQSDMADSQLASGLVPSIAPEITQFVDSEGRSTDFRDSPEWGSAVVLSPWAAYQFYGNPEPLRTHYTSMQRYVTFLQAKARNNLLDYGLGDWYDIGPGAPGYSQLTSKQLTASATFYEDLITMVKIATVLDKPEDARTYTIQAKAVCEAFNAALFHPATKSYDRDSQTANAMPLALGLVPPAARGAVLQSLIADIQKRGYHVTAGDVGFHYVVRALTDNGRSDILSRMLAVTINPSYGYQLAHGATTLTEAWDSNPDSSQNHFMLGHAEEWFYRGLAGIDFDLSRPNGEKIRIAPYVPGKGEPTIQHAAASMQTPIGFVSSAWTLTDGHISVELTIPPNSSAIVELPPGYAHWTESAHSLAHAMGLQIFGDNRVELVSGHYRLEGQSIPSSTSTD